MKRLLVPDPLTRKKVVFYDTPERQAKLKIRCAHDGLKQSEFLRLVVEGYIENNSHIVEFLHECKEKYRFQGKQKRDKILKMSKLGQEKLSDYALDDQDIENIFDILENDV